MTLKEVKNQLNQLEEVNFELPNGEIIPKHFHITEVGAVSKKFVDCGGTLRSEEVINFQLWHDMDFHHRIDSNKMSKIISISERMLDLNDELEIEVEYQGASIQKYGLGIKGENFLLLEKQTDCLARESCGRSEEKPKLDLQDLSGNTENACSPETGCC